MDIDLQSPGLVDGRVEKREKALVVCEYHEVSTCSGAILDE
jgi:hypothetical protein